MEKTLTLSSSHLAWTCIALSALTFFATLMKAEDPYFIIGVLFTVLSSVSIWKHGVVLRQTDYLIIAIYVYQTLSLFWSPQSALVRESIHSGTLPLLYYFTIRCMILDTKMKRNLLLVYCLLFGLFALIALASFFLFQETIRGIDFKNLYEFRHLFRPLGKPNNDWAGLQLLFLGLTTLSVYQNRHSFNIKNWLTILYAIIYFLLLVSFSRGIYISLGIWTIFLLVFGWKSHWKNWLIRLILAEFIVLLLAISLYPQEISTVCKMQYTTSQQRSTQSRLQEAEKIINLNNNYIWTGSGVGTYPLRMNQKVTDNTSQSYTSYAPNVLLQIGIEQGVIGGLLYLLLCIIVTSCVLRQKTWQTTIGLTTLCIFTIREQSFSIFFHSLQAQWLVYTLLAFITNGENGNYPLSGQKHFQRKIIALLPLLACLMVESFLIYRQWVIHHHEKFIQAVRLGQHKQAEEALIYLPHSTPFLITRALYHQARYAETKQTYYAISAHKEWHEAQKQTPEDNMTVFGNICLLAEEGKTKIACHQLDSLIKKHPHNSTFLLKMYELCISRHDSIQAMSYLCKSIQSDPRLLDTSWMKACLQNPIIKHHLYASLSESSNTMEENPLTLARNGKILLELHAYKQAERYLEKALCMLPNLSMPWYNLGTLKAKTGHQQIANLYKHRGITLEYGFPIPLEAIEQFDKQRNSITVPELYGFENLRYHFLFKQWYTYSFNIPY